MCGIVGYVGSQAAAPILVEGLQRLEYRGYDSAGISVLRRAKGDWEAKRVRHAGRVADLAAAVPKRLTGRIGIGHTRWATHGPATEANAHPHASGDDRIQVVHNGIIDNAAVLRTQLESRGIKFTSDTDTEVLAHLIATSQGETLEDAVLDALDRVQGTYALAVLDTAHPDRLVVARNGSPLILGVGENQMFVASDLAALVRHTTTVVHLDDDELATVTADSFVTFSRDRRNTDHEPTEIDLELQAAELGTASHFMIKEIHEQPETVERMLAGRLDDRFGTARLDGLNLDARALRSFRRVKLLGCGSASFISAQGAQLIEELARIPSDSEAAGEFRYRNPVIDPETLYVVVSQSGETADTASAVREIKRKGGTVIGLVNVPGSTIAREVDGGIYLHAGPEVAVASTKALTHMGIACALLALALGRVRDLSIADGQRLVAALRKLPAQIAEALQAEDDIAHIARTLAPAQSLFFIGRVRGVSVAREGSMKFKEITYRHAEAYPASELKHGPLALINEDLPTVAIVPADELVERNLGSVQQIRARGGKVLVVTHDSVDLSELGSDEGVTRLNVPKTEPELDPILLTIPLQVLAYHAALALGLDIDKPRNLAKSVTVE